MLRDRVAPSQGRMEAGWGEAGARLARLDRMFDGAVGEYITNAWADQVIKVKAARVKQVCFCLNLG